MVFIKGRADNMFISGGENISPEEIENALMKHSAVAGAICAGIPDPKWQEVGLALVVVKEGASLTEQELIDFCQGKLARYKIPKQVRFLKELPRTAAGKVLKRELREMVSG